MVDEPRSPVAAGQGSHSDEPFERLLAEIRACRVCAPFLPLGPRPVVQLDPAARILIVSQAPGLAVHRSGIPFDDPSGARLRAWMGVDREVFYDPRKVAVMPMGFCYPGHGKGGDLPPRPECAPLWHPRILAQLGAIRLALLIGRYAVRYYLDARFGGDLTETVRNWRALPPPWLALPHPSPRNGPWFEAHPWFESELLPMLRTRVREALAGVGEVPADAAS